MYSSLLKVDIVVSDKETGRAILVQTDHRSIDEVDDEIEISVLFALTRILAPRRAEEFREAIVRYVAIGGIHPKLACVAASTGATVESENVPFDLTDVEKRVPADLADEAFRELGSKVLAREDLAADEAGLSAFADRLLEDDLDVEDDEIGYWAAVAELAAVTGEVMRAKFGGRWVDDPKDYSDIPFMFKVGDAFMNPVGKSIKCLRHGPSESPVHLIRSVEDASLPQGPLLVTLKPAGWPAAAQVVCEPLMEMESAEGVPLVVFGHDRPNTFAQLMKDGARETKLDELRAEALKNLAAVDVEVEKHEIEALTIWMAHGSYFAAEKILDPAFMREMHERVGSEMLAVGVPEKGRLMVTNAIMSPEVTIAFMGIVRGAFERNEGGRQISPTVFLVSEGRLCGVAAPVTEEPPKKKGFFSRLFN